jgi:hypothetical protein
VLALVAMTVGLGASAADAKSFARACNHPRIETSGWDGHSFGRYYADSDMWNAGGYNVRQHMRVCSAGNWSVTATADNSRHDGAVKTYPNVHRDYHNWNNGHEPALSSFSAISSSFAHAGPHVGIYEFAYDIWLNGVASNGSTEVMIWTDNFNQVPSGSVQETVTFGGQSYRVYKSGNYIAFVDTVNVSSGSLDLLAFFNHIVSKGWIPPTSTLSAVDYGVELVSTNGANATFTVSDFSLTTM